MCVVMGNGYCTRARYLHENGTSLFPSSFTHLSVTTLWATGYRDLSELSVKVNLLACTTNIPGSLALIYYWEYVSLHFSVLPSPVLTLLASGLP